MGRFFHVIAFGAVTLLAPGLLFSQGGGAGTVGDSFSSSMSSSGSGGTVSSSGNGTQTTFTYNYPPGKTVFVIASAPYSGHMSSQTVRTLANGIHLNMQTNDQPMTYRDSVGRTRTDAAMSQAPMIARAAANFKPRIVRLPEISDPVAGFRYVLDDTNRIAYRITIQARQNQAQPRAKLVAQSPVAQAAPHVMENGVTSTSESLGTQSMFGITVAGQRTTTTYPPGTYQGNDGPLTSVSETWRSDQYGLVLLSKNSQPDGSESSTTMKDFSAAEPDPTLFMVPAGYQIVDETGQFTITLAASPK
jgi:hypothetical protein